MTKIDTFSDNQIAKGHNNFSGLTNIELQAVGGNVPDPYLLPVDDLASFLDGVDRVQGDGITHIDGFASTDWLAGALSFSQWYFLYTSILGGKRSGNVTVKTRRYAVPMNGTMSYKYIIANAVLTLRPQPDEQRGDYVAGFKRFLYQFTRIDLNSLLHEDKMYGERVVNGGSASQDNIGTTPVLFTGFDTDGENDGVTLSSSDNSLTIIVAKKYEVQWDLEAVADASHKWTFTVYKNGATTGVATSETISTVEKTISFGRTLDLEAGDIITPFVNSDDGGDTADITAINGRLSLTSK